MSNVTIYHNPRCTKSRQTLDLLRDQGIEPEIVEYLKDPPDVKRLELLIHQLGIQAAELIRAREYRDLGLPNSDDSSELIAQMIAHPEIIQRPIVVKGNSARIGRPPERVLEIL